VPLAAALAGRNAPAGTTAPGVFSGALGEAFANPSFQYLNAGYFVCGFHVAFIATHLPAYIVDQGMPASLGAWALGLVGLFNVFGSILAGVLGDRFSKKYLLSSIYFARAAVIAAFVLVPVSQTSILLFAAAMGLLWLSTVPLTSALVAQMFGIRYLSTLLGVVFLSHQLGSFVSAWLGGELFAATGSYAIAWWVSVALGIAAGLLHWPIDERPIARYVDAD
jgi:MFS family permease